jgi:branched-chain amino acid transport system substrate-binding protein
MWTETQREEVMNIFRKTTGVAGMLMLTTALVTSPASAEVSDNVVRIGVMADQSGPYADNCGPGSVLMVKLAVEDFGGNVNGSPIEVVVADDQNKPDIGVAQALKWLDEEGVDTIVGCSASSIALAVNDIMRDKQKPYLVAGTASAAVTNEACSPMTTNWGFDTYTLAKGAVAAQMAQGMDTWYFITVDYAFGKAWQEDATRFIEAAGGKVVGSTLHPLGTNDFSSQLLQAQASGAKAIGIANAGADLGNLIKQANEFGIAAAGQSLAPLGILINNVHAIGLESTKGLVFSSAAYWDRDDDSRALAKRFSDAFNGRKPNEAQLITYSAVMHYLKAVAASGADDGVSVMTSMRATPVNDAIIKGASIRADGVVMKPMLSSKVKSPSDSKGDWDYYEMIGEIAAEDAWRPASESACALLK